MIKKGPVSKLTEELEKKEAEVAEIKRLMLRKAAEYDNVRKRWEKEREVLRKRIAAEIVADMLDVWDNFERALGVEINQSVDAYKKGVDMIFSQFQVALEKHELKQYSCLGEEFNPARAEAAGFFKTSEAEPGTVIEELKKGFMLGETVLRPAQVIVAKEINKKDSQGDDPGNKEED